MLFKYAFCDYPMPDSSLRVRLCSFFHHHSESARRSRMTAELFLFCHDVLTCIRKYAPIASQGAGFFAKSQIMFFLPSSFRFLPSLKNDGRGELRFREVVNDFSSKKKSTGNVSCPRLSGKVSAELTKGASMSRNTRNIFTERY